MKPLTSVAYEATEATDVSGFIAQLAYEATEATDISGFIAQLVRASHRYREVTGSNPVEVLTFSGFYTQLLKLR